MATPEPIHIERIVIEADIPLSVALANSGLPSLVGIALTVGVVITLTEWHIKRRQRKEAT